MADTSLSPRPSPWLPALEDARERYARIRPRSAEAFRRAGVVLPGGSTRSVLDVAPFPFRVVSAAGGELTDVDGHTCIDLLGDYSAGLLGHDPGPIAAAVNAALERGWAYGGVHLDEIRLAETVVDRFPSIEQVRFTNSGTEANLMAVQLARHHTGRDRIVVMDHAYHGGLLYFGSGGGPLLAPFAFTRVAFNDPDAARAITGDVAAVLVEPMMGAAGCIPAEPEFLAGLREATERAGALLIFDEVMTSRMGWGGAQARIGVTPDLTTLGKYLAGGMTFGAFGGRADVMAAFDPARPGALSHGGTFNNNVVTMAAGVAAAELLDAATLDRHFDRGERFRARVAEVLAASGLPLSVTGMGSLASVHATAGPVTTPSRRVTTADPVLAELVYHELLAHGVYLAPRGYYALSLALDDDQLDRALAALTAAVAAVAAAA
ncbi:MAG: aspartate aminotransferase family protein [Acidimicrobiales bacterium]